MITSNKIIDNNICYVMYNALFTYFNLEKHFYTLQTLNIQKKRFF